VEPGQNPSGQNPSGESSSGWHRDPMGRFEYRYFNGVQWTSDVSINGQRYVDAPMSSIAPVSPTPRPRRGQAIASFIIGMSAVALGWVPFVFVLAALAAVVALVFGILGLNVSRHNDGYGRGFAIAGIVLAPIALVVCVGGFFFTRAVVDAVHDFVEPGPHELFVEQPCTLENGQATATGTIRNLDDHERDYRIFLDFFDEDDDLTGSTVAVRDVAPGETKAWTSSVQLDGSSVECKVSEVFGPVPFDLDDGG
jgi:Protein of unknown function (DUF2510)